MRYSVGKVKSAEKSVAKAAVEGRGRGSRVREQLLAPSPQEVVSQKSSSKKRRPVVFRICSGLSCPPFCSQNRPVMMLTAIS